MKERLPLAAAVAVPGALLGGAASKAIGLHHFWPGVIVAWIGGALLFLTLTRRS